MMVFYEIYVIVFYFNILICHCFLYFHSVKALMFCLTLIFQSEHPSLQSCSQSLYILLPYVPAFQSMLINACTHTTHICLAFDTIDVTSPDDLVMLAPILHFVAAYSVLLRSSVVSEILHAIALCGLQSIYFAMRTYPSVLASLLQRLMNSESNDRDGVPLQRVYMGEIYH